MTCGKSACDGAQGDRGFPMTCGKSVCDGAQGVPHGWRQVCV